MFGRLDEEFTEDYGKVTVAIATTTLVGAGAMLIFVPGGRLLNLLHL
jgi:hypothetical protein